MSDRATELETRTLRPRNRLLLDLALFVALVVAANPTWTGLSLHAWLSGVLIIPVLYHLTINWDWVMSTVHRFRARLKSISRINLVVDTVLFLASVTVMLTGFMVLPGVVSPDPDSVIARVWRDAHGLASDVTVMAMVVHLSLHAEWIYETTARMLKPARAQVTRLPHESTYRRDA